MKDYQKRVLIEKSELDEKIENLSSFINTNELFNSISVSERGKLRVQLSTMREYSNILNDRIESFID